MLPVVRETQNASGLVERLGPIKQSPAFHVPDADERALGIGGGQKPTIRGKRDRLERGVGGESESLGLIGEEGAVDRQRRDIDQANATGGLLDVGGRGHRQRAFGDEDARRPRAANRPAGSILQPPDSSDDPRAGQEVKALGGEAHLVDLSRIDGAFPVRTASDFAPRLEVPRFQGDVDAAPHEPSRIADEGHRVNPGAVVSQDLRGFKLLLGRDHPGMDRAGVGETSRDR